MVVWKSGNIGNMEMRKQGNRETCRYENMEMKKQGKIETWKYRHREIWN